jgi:hypothetical protein
LKLILGFVVGVLGARLSRRDSVRNQLREWFAVTPASVRERAESVRSAAVTGAQRLTQVVNSAPLPQVVKSAVQKPLAAAQATREAKGSNGSARSAENIGLSQSEQGEITEEVLAEQDAATRASEEARREQQAGS